MWNWIGKGFEACESIHGRTWSGLEPNLVQLGSFTGNWIGLGESCENVKWSLMPSKRFSRSICQSEFGVERDTEREREIQGEGFYCGWLPQVLILCAIVMAIMDRLANGLWGLYFSAVSEKETSLGKKDLLCQPSSIFRLFMKSATKSVVLGRTSLSSEDKSALPRIWVFVHFVFWISSFRIWDEILGVWTWPLSSIGL